MSKQTKLLFLVIGFNIFIAGVRFLYEEITEPEWDDTRYALNVEVNEAYDEMMKIIYDENYTQEEKDAARAKFENAKAARDSFLAETKKKAIEKRNKAKEDAEQSDAE